MFSKIKNNAIKSIAILLSAITVISTGMPTTLATPNPKNSQQTNINEKTKNKKHTGVLVAISGCPLIIGGTVLVRYLWNTRDIQTAISGLSSQEIDEEISRQIQIYKDRAPDVFEFDDNLLATIDHKILLLSLMKINYLFDKYRYFTDNFIRLKRENNLASDLRTFKLELGGNDMDRKTIMVTNVDYIRFSPIHLRDYVRFVAMTRAHVRNGFFSMADDSHLVNQSIAHEFGHLMEYTYRAMWLLEHGGCMNGGVHIANVTEEDREWFLDSYRNIKNDILQGIEGESRIISRYGESNEAEFFAEAFAHLECTDNPDDVNEIGRRIENYLVNTMGCLPRENSKFNN